MSFVLLYGLDIQFINLFKLIGLDIDEKYVSYIIISTSIWISYLLIRPIIKWFIRQESARLLSYLMSSLFVVVLLFFILLMMNESSYFVKNILKVTLECLAFFGVGLIVVYSFRRIIRKA